MVKRFFSFLLLCVFLLPLHVSASARSGDLIKGSGSAVYFFGANGKRYVFPSDRVYFSWYADFASVRTISDTELASYSLGGNVTYRPGTRLVKITTDPRVYAVSRGGTLHWVQTEAMAARLYGSDWAHQIDDIPDAFFVSYSIGSSLGAATDFSPSGEISATTNINVDKGLQGGGVIVVPTPLPTPTPTPVPVMGLYDIGSPTLQDIWVNPTSGNDRNDGRTRATAVATLVAAWNQIPEGRLSGTGYRILLTRGTYGEAQLGAGFFMHRYGTQQFPVILEAADGARTVTVTQPIELQDNAHLYVMNIDFVSNPGAGNIVHIASPPPVGSPITCDYILLRNVRIIGDNNPQEALKVNQCRHVYIENSEIAGGHNAGVDYVGVQYGHIKNTKFHDSEWCIYLKGGTSYMTIEGNDISHCATGAYSSGNSTSFDYMVAPWLHYESYDLKFINNVIHDNPGHGFGVFGAYNSLIAYNTFYRVATDGIHPMGVIGFGGRGCGDDREYAPGNCAAYNRLGGWGPASQSLGGEWIPNKNVYIYNNVFYNPEPIRTSEDSGPYSHFVIYSPVSPPSSTNIPSPSHTDTNLQIRGNSIWNEPSRLNGADSIGIASGTCANETCNADQILRDNSINSSEPRLQSPGTGDYRPIIGGIVLRTPGVAIPAFTWTGLPASPSVPVGNLSNTVSQKRDGSLRSDTHPGAY